MDLGVENECEFAENPRERPWVADDPDTPISPGDDVVTCSREPVGDSGYCAFHLRPSEQEELEIDTGKRLRERLEEVRRDNVATAEYLDFRGAFLTEADLSELEFGDMKVSIDLRYADIEGGVNLSGLSLQGNVDCRFVRCDTITGAGTNIRRLSCAGGTLRNRSPTAMGRIDRAFSLRQDASITDVELTGAEIQGNVFINDVGVENQINCLGLAVQGKYHLNLNGEADACGLSDAEIAGKLYVENSTFRRMNCSRVSAEKIIFQDVNIEEGDDSSGGIECAEAVADEFVFQNVTTDTLQAVSLSVATLRLENVTVRNEARFDRGEDVPETLQRLRVTGCHFYGETVFNRLGPETAEFSIALAEGPVSFSHFECQDTTFDPDGYPMFEDTVDFTGADLENATLRNFEAGGQAVFTNADLTDARLLNADLSGAVLEGALLSRARLVETDLEHAYLYHASLSDASVDVSTEFGDRVVYDPKSDQLSDSDARLIEHNRSTAATTTDGTEDQISADGGVLTAGTGSDDQSDGEPRVTQAQKAKAVYQSIHNAARQSGDSATAIDMYRKRQQMETEIIRQGHTSDGGVLPPRVRAFAHRLYGVFAGYGVGSSRILGTSLVLMLISLGSLLAVSGGEIDTALYFIGGFVGSTPGLNATPEVHLIIGIEALAGALLVALYINALGRRSSM